jgi:hypothetical protein
MGLYEQIIEAEKTKIDFSMPEQLKDINNQLKNKEITEEDAINKIYNYLVWESKNLKNRKSLQ